MNLNIYTVYDTKAQAYLAPYFMHADGMAIREFSNAVNNERHHFSRNPEDYILFSIGVFDDNTAEIKSATPQTLGSGHHFVKNEHTNPTEEINS